MKTLIFALLAFISTITFSQTRQAYVDSVRATTSWDSVYIGGVWEGWLSIVLDSLPSTQTVYMIAGTDTVTAASAKWIIAYPLKWGDSSSFLTDNLITNAGYLRFKTSAGSYMIHFRKSAVGSKR